MKGSTHTFNATIRWGFDEYLDYELNVTRDRDGAEIAENSGTVSSLASTGTTFNLPVTFDENGDHTACVSGTLQDGSAADQVCTTIESLCTRGRPGGVPGRPGSCCAGDIFRGGACYPPTVTVDGTVTLIESDRSPRLVTDAVVTVENLDTGDTESTTTTNGDYEFTDFPEGELFVRAEYLDSFYNESDPITTTGGNTYTINLNLTEVEYFSDCTNTAGRCDRDAFGRNGCLMPGTPNRTQRQETLYACDPEGSAGRSPGDLVFVEQNATHRREALCCSEVGEWRPAPTAKIEGNVNNLIKYTRLTTYLGQPVRLVIATWN